MIAIDVADLVVIAARVTGTGPGAALDQLDVAAAQAALAEARLADAGLADAGLADAGLAAADAGLAAAVLMRALLRHRPFPGHSQQIAVAAGLQFLALNGWQADLDPPGAALVVVEGLASGRLSPADAAAWLSARLSAGSHQTPIREAPMRSLLSGRRFRAIDPRPRAGILTPVTGFLPFTDDARDVVVAARQEADRLRRPCASRSRRSRRSPPSTRRRSGPDPVPRWPCWSCRMPWARRWLTVTTTSGPSTSCWPCSTPTTTRRPGRWPASAPGSARSVPRSRR